MGRRASGQTYKDAGVDFDAADAAKQGIKALAATTHGPQVLGGVGGFGGLFELSGYRKPVLVSGTDNVGTKLKIALAMRQFENLGRDVVNACVNDVIVCGAKPLFFLDYIATGIMDAGLAEETNRLVVDRLVADAVRDQAGSGAQQSLGVLLVEEVGGHGEVVLAGAGDHGGVGLG